MNFYQVNKFYEPKKDFPCPITSHLVTSGYRQKRGGYIQAAKMIGLKEPSQWWHLIELYCNGENPTRKFPYVQCGELILWMAETAECICVSELNNLVNDVLQDRTNRRRGNQLIYEKCIESIIKTVELAVPYNEGQ